MKTGNEHKTIESAYADMRAEISRKFKDADPLSLELMFNLLHTANIAQNQWSELARKFDLTSTAFNVLGLLSYRGKEGMPFHEVSQLLLVSRANVTGLIDSLESKGLVERVDHKTDRRVYLARITKKGKTLIDAYRPRHISAVKSMASNLNRIEKKTLIDLLEKWRSSFESIRMEK